MPRTTFDSGISEHKPTDPLTVIEWKQVEKALNSGMYQTFSTNTGRIVTIHYGAFIGNGIRYMPGDMWIDTRDGQAYMNFEGKWEKTDPYGRVGAPVVETEFTEEGLVPELPEEYQGYFVDGDLAGTQRVFEKGVPDWYVHKFVSAWGLATSQLYVRVPSPEDDGPYWDFILKETMESRQR